MKILVFSVLFSLVFLFPGCDKIASSQNRYTIVETDTGVYKLNKKTGQYWYLIGDKEINPKIDNYIRETYLMGKKYYDLPEYDKHYAKMDSLEKRSIFYNALL